MRFSCAAAGTLLLGALTNCSPGVAQDRREQAWGILRANVTEKDTGKRAQSVRVLGLLQGEPEAVEIARKALGDNKPEVRESNAEGVDR